jgi:hypothetical protein
MELKRRADDRRQQNLGGQEATPGYAVNGTSQWERQAANGGSADTKLTARSVRDRQEWSRLDVLVKHESNVVERLERRAAEAKQSGDADKAAKICVRLQRTRFLLTRLRNEQRELVP